MKIKLFFKKTLNENAALLYDESKKFKQKADGARKAILETEKKLVKAIKRSKIEDKKKIVVKESVEREWFERFRFFRTTNGLLVVAGKDAKQNDSLYKNYFTNADLFFHANIQGSPAVILLKAVEAKEEDLLETAQWTASYSSAWNRGLLSVDVYCAEKKQVDKRVSGEYLAQGAFMIRGQRKWFKNTELGLKIGLRDGVVVVQPSLNETKLELVFKLVPGNKEKKSVTKRIVAVLDCREEAVSQLIPGNSTVID
ncbi:MAG: NFACT RNA binding domain-containing protein [Candidatus Micrarchaeota archaeon]